MNPAIGAPQNAQNYLVPSSGGTHAIPISGVFAGQPYIVDWRQFNTDQFAFQPQGIYIDNTQGTGLLTVEILPIGWSVTCPAGSQVAQQFPAPNGQSWSITGDGQATVIAVDYPVLPSAGVVTVSGTVPVDIIGPNPLPTQPTVNAGGAPYQVEIIPQPATAFFADTITVGTNVCTIVPPAANANLKKLIISFRGDCAAASPSYYTVTLNGANVYAEVYALPTASPTTALQGAILYRELDFSNIALSAGAGPGNLVVTLGASLTAGTVSVNAYFD